MLKHVIFLVVLLFSNLSVAKKLETSREKFFCSTYYAFIYLEEAKQLSNDKVMHCAMSCWLSLKCPKTEVSMFGWLKELYDYLGFGHPDEEDIQANKTGIEISNFVTNRQECTNECQNRYQE